MPTDLGYEKHWDRSMIHDQSVGVVRRRKCHFEVQCFLEPAVIVEGSISGRISIANNFAVVTRLSERSRHNHLLPVSMHALNDGHDEL